MKEIIIQGPSWSLYASRKRYPIDLSVGQAYSQIFYFTTEHVLHALKCFGHTMRRPNSLCSAGRDGKAEPSKPSISNPWNYRKDGERITRFANEKFINQIC